jgi:hypothetical protein
MLVGDPQLSNHYRVPARWANIRCTRPRASWFGRRLEFGDPSVMSAGSSVGKKYLTGSGVVREAIFRH